MHVKNQQKFTSRRTGDVIKVTKIKRDISLDSKFDVITVADTKNGKVIQGTQRTVYADSIRRRYFKV